MIEAIPPPMAGAALDFAGGEDGKFHRTKKRVNGPLNARHLTRFVRYLSTRDQDTVNSKNGRSCSPD